MVIPSCPIAGCGRYVPKKRSHQGKLKPKLLFVSRMMTEWWTRCISGVTTNNRSRRSSPSRQADVPVAEHRGPVQQDLEDEDRQGGNAEGRHRRKFDQRGEVDLQGVKAQPRGDVDVEIGVVHAVEAPEEREHVEHHVLEVDDQIEEQDADQDRRPEGHRQMVQGPPPAGGGEQGETDGEDGVQEARHTRIDQGYGEVDPPAGGLTRGERTAGRADFGEGNGNEDWRKKPNRIAAS